VPVVIRRLRRSVHGQSGANVALVQSSRRRSQRSGCSQDHLPPPASSPVLMGLGKVQLPHTIPLKEPCDQSRGRLTRPRLRCRIALSGKLWKKRRMS
jgi:hypothetical protein